jgi:hypothetical protein
MNGVYCGSAPTIYNEDARPAGKKNIQNYENENVRGIGEGEARLKKNKRPKLGGGQAYYRSSD